MPKRLSLCPDPLTVKNLSLALHGIWLVAVAVLFYLVLSKPAGPAAVSPAAGDSTATTAAAEIVYVNTDTLFEKYQLAIDSRKELESRSQRLRSELQGRGQRLQQQLQEAQQAARGMTPQQFQNTERTLMAAQQQFEQYRENQTAQLQKFEQDRQKQLLDNLQATLRELNATGQYQFVMGFTRTGGGGILLAPEGRDITAQVLDALNAKYTAQQAAKK